MTTKFYHVYCGTMDNKNPRVLLQNKLLREYGFREGDNIKVTFDNGKIIIEKPVVVAEQTKSVDPQCTNCRMAKYCVGQNSNHCPLKNKEV